MITLKQIEALHWIAELGSFERAAAQLNTTQSTVSKRIQQLGVPGLDDHRLPRLQQVAN